MYTYIFGVQMDGCDYATTTHASIERKISWPGRRRLLARLGRAEEPWCRRPRSEGGLVDGGRVSRVLEDDDVNQDDGTDGPAKKTAGSGCKSHELTIHQGNHHLHHDVGERHERR